MLSKKWAVLIAVLIISSIVLTACPTPTPEVVTVKETVVVTEEVKVVETVIVTEEKVVTEEKIVEVTPIPDAGMEKTTMHWNLGTEPPTLDPALASDTTSVDVDENLFLGLTGFDSSGNVVPELATEWSVSDDLLEYTFNMRDDAVWVNYKPSTGITEIGPVTANDVVYGVNRTCDPDTASTYSYVNYIIAGCEEWNTADTTALSEEEVQALADGVGVEAVDDYTVKFTINAPAPYFPAIAGMWVNRPMPQATIEEFGEKWTEAGNIVTNGPYVLDEWFHSDSMTLEKNPTWYGWDEAGNIDRIEMFMIQEASTAFAMYEAGEMDTVGVPLPDVDRVKADPVLSQEFTNAPDACTYYYGFTNTKPPMDDVLVRKALSAAIDRKTLVEAVTKGGQIPANTFAPAMIFGNAAEDTDIAPWALSEEQGGWGYEKALEQAKAWLAEAGYPDGEGFPTISIMHNTSEGHASIAQAIQAMWKDALGIDVSIENQEWRVYLTTIGNATPVEEVSHVWRLGWCADYPDQNNWVHEVFNSDAGANRLRWDESANAALSEDGLSFNELTVAAQQSVDPAERAALYKQAEKILSEGAAAYAPIYYYTVVNVTKPYLERTFDQLGGNRWYTWELDYDAKKAATGM
ncbi:MAG: peptide ABC transporter substrate-binding protein [Chloroflexota bacterium]|nr:peptide ABC transporter substrate-binding protein [Chloroflexota bacterium]